MRLGRISKLITPTYDYCKNCNTTWRFVKSHITPVIIKDQWVDTFGGIWLFCEKCFLEIPYEQKRQAYLKYHWQIPAPVFNIKDLLFSLEVDQKLTNQGLDMYGMAPSQIMGAWYLAPEVLSF